MYKEKRRITKLTRTSKRTFRWQSADSDYGLQQDIPDMSNSDYEAAKTEFLRKLISCDYKDIENIALLIQRDNDGKTVLMYAAEHGYLDIVKFTIKTGVNIEEKDNAEETALLLATWKNHTDVVDFLLSKGANVEVAQKDGYTPLIYAVRQGNLRLVDSFLSRGAHINETDKTGTDAIKWAAREDFEEFSPESLVIDDQMHSKF
ncbi:hypothetical protein ILUMI_13275 [Ignelater luminosus]|uniref:Ankyrin repeat protein n=1 Tax=Ignelater luminosus TaxID=2038154 RepID=A0A8K0CSN9_IGNLU|nr:hypothetical protein ILUMI_13275 [Ignelater luminosus]